MALSTFDGEPTVHEHYDADGNLTGTTVVPGWSDDDRAWALGLAQREADQCPRGHDLSESLDEDSGKWVAELPRTCFACVALDGDVTKYQQNPEHRALLHVVTKVPRRDKPKRKG